MLCDDLITTVANRWVSGQLIDCLVTLLKEQPNDLNILFAQKIGAQANLSTEKSYCLKSLTDKSKNKFAIICNVTSDHTFGTTIRVDALGNHWSLIFVDVLSKTITYCDNKSKKTPQNLKDFVLPFLEVVGLQYNVFSVKSTHPVMISGEILPSL